MGIHTSPSTVAGGVTPICNECGVSLCWDISRTEYLEAKAFWDDWTCQECHGSRQSAYAWSKQFGHEALSLELSALTHDFAKAHLSTEASFRSGDDAAHNAAQCDAMCTAFATELRNHDLSSETCLIAASTEHEHKGLRLGA